jgi:CRISPR-associated protein Cmr3
MSAELIIHPRDPLLFRDGRPFSADPGAEARSLPFPLPSTVCGAVRTMVGNANGWDWAANGPGLALKVGVKGPLLLARGRDEGWRVYVRAPADVLARPPKEERRPPVYCALRPRPGLPEGAGTLWPEEAGSDLWPLRPPFSEKPATGREWWPLKGALEFLAGGEPPEWDDCLPAFGREARMHVQMDPATAAARTGMLFSTESLALPDVPSGRNGSGKGNGKGAKAVAFLVRVERCEAEWPGETVMPLGGERRFALVSPPEKELWPAPPQDWAEKLAGRLCESGRLKLQVVTPALFEKGWLPGWLDTALTGTVPGTGLKVRLRAAAIPRPIGFSGWDYEARGPKKARLAVRDGSVYFFELLDSHPSVEDVRNLFLASVCDGEQENRDGFGLALPGVWEPAGEED